MRFPFRAGRTAPWILVAAGPLVLVAAPAVADSVVLANGDVLTGTLVERNDEALVLEHDVLGTLTLPRERVASFAEGEEAVAGGPGAVPPVASAAAAVSTPAPEAPKPGLFGTRFLRGWERHIELGIDGSEGNTEEFDGVARLLARAANARRRWKVDAGYYYSTENEVASQHKGHFELLRDWLHADSRWFQFADARWDYDQFEDWDQRIALAGGTGYELVQRPELDVRTRLGLSLQRTFGGQDDEITPELLLGVEGEWRISERVQLTLENLFLPSLRVPGELRNQTDAALYLAISEADGLGFKVGFRNEYESDVPDDIEQNDIRYYGALTIGF